MNKEIFPNGGLRRIINAAGTMTGLGANRICEEAIAAAVAVSPHFVSIDELQEKASGVIARATGAEAGCITACSAAGVTLSVAACITGDDPEKIERLPDSGGMQNGVILQTGHNINYGANIEQAIRLAGGRVVTVGGATEANVYQLRARLREGAAAALYVVSHHCAQEGMISLECFVAECQAHGVPVIADMASEYNLRVAENPGADIAVYSAHKFIAGPTGGIVAGRANLARAVYLQNRGIGRQMKIGKEGICGVVAALEAHLLRNTSQESRQWRTILSSWQKLLENEQGLRAEIIPDWTGNPMERLQLTVVPEQAGLFAWELAARLRDGDPMIFAREQFLEHGRLILDPCHLQGSEAETVVQHILSAIADARKCKNGLQLRWSDYKKNEAESALSWRGTGAKTTDDNI